MTEEVARTTKNALRKTMKTQLMSVLKGVIDEDEQNDDNELNNEEELISNCIFDQEESDDDDDYNEEESDTRADTVYLTSFLREPHDKPQTTIGIDTTKFEAHNTFFNDEQLSRKTTRKFQTQTANANDLHNQINDSYIHHPSNKTLNALFHPANQIKINNTYQYQKPSIIYNFKSSFANQNIQQQQVQWLQQVNRITLKNHSNTMENNLFDEETYLQYKGQFAHIIKNQQTSRLFQTYIDNTSSEIIHLIFDEILASKQISKLLCDSYANYFLLKLFCFLNHDARISFLSQISNDFVYLCSNKISTYPIQCIIEHLTSLDEQTIVINSIQHSLKTIALDMYGTHVIEKVLTSFEYDLIQSISNFVLNNFLYLANHANGLCIIKKEIIMEYKKNGHNRLKNELRNNAMHLIQNPFGNYSLQMAIENWDLSDTEEIMNQFLGQCAMLSLQKFSSNVIEKCIIKSEQFASLFIQEICYNYNSIGYLMNNNFGNYVIQTALKSTRLNTRMILINTINTSLELISDMKLIWKWRNILSSYLQ